MSEEGPTPRCSNYSGLEISARSQVPLVSLIYHGHCHFQSYTDSWLVPRCSISCQHDDIREKKGFVFHLPVLVGGA